VRIRKENYLIMGNIINQNHVMYKIIRLKIMEIYFNRDQRSEEHHLNSDIILQNYNIFDNHSKQNEDKYIWENVIIGSVVQM
jgi:hypothetical protein